MPGPARSSNELLDRDLWSLEHDPAWADEARRRLEDEGLATLATVLDAPLRPHPLAVATGGWYDTAALERLPPSGVELLLVDGPPASPDSPGRSACAFPPCRSSRAAWRRTQSWCSTTRTAPVSAGCWSAGVRTCGGSSCRRRAAWPSRVSRIRGEG